ncbi:hypothetical protein D1007_40005 [Hordeum vulgare]|nr:hypothetical protein D1007_40005 [Hordeum vulgare]
MVGGFPNKGKAPLFPRATSQSSSSRPRQRVSVPVHQARWHWEHRVALPYPDVTLPHGWHLDPERIPVSAVPRSTRVHLEEHRRGVRQVQPRGPPSASPVVSDEDQEAEAAYHAALAGVLHDSEEKARRAAEEKEAYQRQLAEAMALSAVGDCIVPPPPEPEPEPALPRQAERVEGLWLMELEKEERREAEEERARAVALPPPPSQPAPAGQTTDAQAAALWNSAFLWVGLAPTLVDLTGPNDDA